MAHLVTAHSYYSLLEGGSSPLALASRAAEQGCAAFALTDHNMLTGAVEFALACRKVSIRPIFGLEVDINDSSANTGTGQHSRLTLLSENAEGWSNLSRLSSLTNLEKSRPFTIDEIARHSDGLIFLSGGTRGIFNLLLRQGQTASIKSISKEYAEIFHQRFYFRITGIPQLDGEEAILSDILEQMHIPQVLAAEVFYLDQSDEPTHRLLSAIRHNSTVDQIRPEHGYTPQAAFPDLHFLDSTAARYPVAHQNAQAIQDRCQFQMPFGVVRFPTVPLPDGKNASQTLRDKAYQGAKNHYGSVTSVVSDRLDYELNIISQSGYEPIFLIMEELLTFARQRGILFSSRGSAASSLVAHCLGITSPDPLRLSLYFERFLNPARSTPPDIDTDIDSRRRDEIIQHCFDIYGTDHVAMVATINRFRPRSAVGDAAKALGFSPEEARKIASELPHFFFAGRSTSDEPDNEIQMFSEAAARHPEPRYQELFSYSSRILGNPRHLSVHPGGLVISPGAMTDLVPVMRSGGKGVQISQFDLESLAYLGLVKIDLLGIRGLTVLGDVAAAIHSWSKADYSTPSSVIENIPLEDQATGNIVSAGKTIGCFQIESPGMRSTLKQIHACTPDDIMAALALYRPGPLRGGLRDSFIRRHNHEEEVSHLHPSLAATLSDTYGVILYQEQVLRIAHELGGLSLAESDMLRRAMSHFDPGKQMQNLKEKFIHGIGEMHQVQPELAEQIWEMMAAFAGYGFPKAHAASYAQIAWNSAWCKSHFPAEFMAAVLANWGGYYSQRVYLMEARRLGYAAKPPHINFSGSECTVIYPSGDPVLYLGLGQVRDLTNRTIQMIILKRPFESLDDFLIKVDPRPQEARNLIRCGALSGMGRIPSLLQHLESGSRQPGQPSLFDQAMIVDLEEWPLEARIAAQQEVLGIGVDAHPLEVYADRLHKIHAISTSDALEKTGEKIVVAGVRQSHRRSRTSSGEMMAFLSLEDFEGTLDVILFPAVYRATQKDVFSENKPIIIEGTVETDANQEEPFLRADRVFLLK